MTTTVWSSITRTLSIAAKVRLSLLVLFSAAARSNAYFTVAALKGSPLLNFTPWRRKKVTVRRSGEISQRSASKGPTLPSALILVSVSKTL